MSFEDLSAALAAVEKDRCRITKIFHPEVGRVWHGVYGSAVAVEPDEIGIGYITNDGKRHTL